MEQELNQIEDLIASWEKAKKKADIAATRHKHLTAAEVSVMDESITRAKELVTASEDWYKRQLVVDELHIASMVAKERLEQAIRRWETARSVYSATRKVA